MFINITQAKVAVQRALEAGLVPNLVGSPGLGKSDLIRQIAEDNNLKVIDFRLAQADPTDLMGFPSLNEDKTRSHYAAPETFPLEGDHIPEGYNGWMLFFDEMSSAPMSVQAASYKIILDRMVGEHNLHKNVAMVCAGNLTTDKAIVNRLSTAMQSRMVHLNLEVDQEAWIDWALKKGIDHRIIGFIRFRPELLHKFDPSHSDNTFPCPRTWEFLSRIIKNMKKIEAADLPLMAGTIGEGPALEFKGHTDIYETLPSVEQLLNQPGTVKIPTEPSTLYAITSLISAKATKETIQKFMILVERLPIEFQVITLQGITKVDKTMLKEQCIKMWIAANANELV